MLCSIFVAGGFSRTVFSLIIFVLQVGVKKVGGGSVTDSFLVKGVAFKKTFSYAGFEQQPKSFDNPDILLLNVELELKSEKVRPRPRGGTGSGVIGSGGGIDIVYLGGLP